MSRHTGPVCRSCRREGLKIYLKSDRCFTDKCSFERNQNPPGQHGQRRMRVSDYGQQLREKQKVKRIYGILEKQFRRYYAEASRRKGNTGETLLTLLESRLDSTVFRLGFAGTRSEARQLISHGHIQINGRRVDIASYQVRVGDVISVRKRSRKIQRVVDSLDKAVNRPQMSWMNLDKDNFSGTIGGAPIRTELTLPIQENLIVELCSR